MVFVGEKVHLFDIVKAVVRTALGSGQKCAPLLEKSDHIREVFPDPGIATFPIPFRQLLHVRKRLVHQKSEELVVFIGLFELADRFVAWGIPSPAYLQ